MSSNVERLLWATVIGLTAEAEANGEREKSLARVARTRTLSSEAVRDARKSVYSASQ